MAKGKVFLIGAGPGDPGLLTLKGRDILAKADVVVYDALINPQLLIGPSPARSNYSSANKAAATAKNKLKLMISWPRKAAQGKLVARLKGGDPFLFGRGGEEAAFLADENISFEVIPGISSASGVSAYVGVPLTDRRLSSMVTFVTGQEGEGNRTAPVEWPRISRESTLVIFMRSRSGFLILPNACAATSGMNICLPYGGSMGLDRRGSA